MRDKPMTVMHWVLLVVTIVTGIVIVVIEATLPVSLLVFGILTYAWWALFYDTMWKWLDGKYEIDRPNFFYVNLILLGSEIKWLLYVIVALLITIALILYE